MSIHFQKLRTITRKFYRMRELIIIFFSIGKYLIEGRTIDLVNVLDNLKKNKSLMKESTQTCVINKVSDNLVNYDIFCLKYNEFHNELKSRLDLNPCSLCNKLFRPIDLMSIKQQPTQIQKSYLIEILGNRFELEQLKICRNFCAKDYINETILKINNSLR